MGSSGQMAGGGGQQKSCSFISCEQVVKVGGFEQRNGKRDSRIISHLPFQVRKGGGGFRGTEGWWSLEGGNALVSCFE